MDLKISIRIENEKVEVFSEKTKKKIYQNIDKNLFKIYNETDFYSKFNITSNIGQGMSYSDDGNYIHTMKVVSTSDTLNGLKKQWAEISLEDDELLKSIHLKIDDILVDLENEVMSDNFNLIDNVWIPKIEKLKTQQINMLKNILLNASKTVKIEYNNLTLLVDFYVYQKIQSRTPFSSIVENGDNVERASFTESDIDKIVPIYENKIVEFQDKVLADINSLSQSNDIDFIVDYKLEEV